MQTFVVNKWALCGSEHLFRHILNCRIGYQPHRLGTVSNEPADSKICFVIKSSKVHPMYNTVKQEARPEYVIGKYGYLNIHIDFLYADWVNPSHTYFRSYQKRNTSSWFAMVWFGSKVHPLGNFVKQRTGPEYIIRKHGYLQIDIL